MANYLEVIYDVTVTSGNESTSFNDGDLVNPYDIWAAPLIAAGAVTDSGTPAPNLGGGTPNPYVANYGQYVEIYELADATIDLQHHHLRSEIQATSGTAQTVNIPSDADLRFAPGAFIRIRQMGAGSVTITADGSITLFTPYGATIDSQYGSVYLFKTNESKWVVIPEGGGGGGTDDQTASEVSFTPTSGISAINVQLALAELDAEKQSLSAKGAVNGYASLDGTGKIPSGQLPAIALADVYPVANIAARDALSVQEGDVAIVTDTGSGDPGSFIYDGSGWQPLNYASGAVTSINGGTP